MPRGQCKKGRHVQFLYVICIVHTKNGRRVYSVQEGQAKPRDLSVTGLKRATPLGGKLGFCPIHKSNFLEHLALGGPFAGENHLQDPASPVQPMERQGVVFLSATEPGGGEYRNARPPTDARCTLENAKNLRGDHPIIHVHYVVHRIVGKQRPTYSNADSNGSRAKTSRLGP
jgi:hypothetical protein